MAMVEIPDGLGSVDGALEVVGDTMLEDSESGRLQSRKRWVPGKLLVPLCPQQPKQESVLYPVREHRPSFLFQKAQVRREDLPPSPPGKWRIPGEWKEMSGLRNAETSVPWDVYLYRRYGPCQLISSCRRICHS